MKPFALFVALLLVCASCHAQSVLIGKRLISKGDDVSRVRDIAGPPDKVDHIPADEYSPAMEIWNYQRKENTVTLWIVNSKVVQAQAQPAPVADATAGGPGGSAAAR